MYLIETAETSSGSGWTSGVFNQTVLQTPHLVLSVPERTHRGYSGWWSRTKCGEADTTNEPARRFADSAFSSWVPEKMLRLYTGWSGTKCGEADTASQRAHRRQRTRLWPACTSEWNCVCVLDYNFVWSGRCFPVPDIFWEECSLAFSAAYFPTISTNPALADPPSGFNWC